MKDSDRGFRVALALTLCVGASADCRIAPGRVNVECRWANDPIATASRPADRQDHLTTDAVVAEELAIRYADATRGFRSGHYVDAQMYASARDDCQAKLLAEIAATHDVDAQYLRGLMHRRPTTFDISVVFLPVALAFALLASGIIGWIDRRFSRDERWARTVSLVLSAIALDVLFYQLGSIWSFFAEERLRFGTNHLSYRAFYVPWERHKVVVAVIGMALFWLLAAARHRLADRKDGASGPDEVSGSFLR